MFVNILDDAIIARYFEFQIGNGMLVLAFHDSAPFMFLNSLTQVPVSLPHFFFLRPTLLQQQRRPEQNSGLVLYVVLYVSLL